MRSKRKVLNYAKIIAKETGLPLKKVNLILVYGWRNICKMIENGEEVRIKGLGRIYFNKESKKEEKIKKEEQVEIPVRKGHW